MGKEGVPFISLLAVIQISAGLKTEIVAPTETSR